MKEWNGEKSRGDEKAGSSAPVAGGWGRPGRGLCTSGGDREEEREKETEGG